MRYLTLGEVLDLHGRILAATGGGDGIRDLGGLESAIAQPRATFDGKDLYPTLEAKVAAIGYSLVNNHPFVDGNKRIAHASMEMMLLLNGHEFTATMEEQERLVLDLATGSADRDKLLTWIKANCGSRGTPETKDS